MKRKEYSKQFKEDVVRATETGDKYPALLVRELGCGVTSRTNGKNKCA